MDRDTAVTLIKQKCGFRTDPTLTQRIISALQLAQEELEKGGVMTAAGYATEVPWFLRKEDQPLNLLANTNEVNLPADFIREVEDEGPWYPNSTGAGNPPIYLDKAESGAARRSFTGATSGPQVYQLRASTIWLFPSTDTDLTFYWTYLGKDDALTTNIENKWLKWVPNLLVGHAGLSIATDLRDKDAAQEFNRLEVTGQKQLLILNVQRQMTNRRTAIGRNK